MTIMFSGQLWRKVLSLRMSNRPLCDATRGTVPQLGVRDQDLNFPSAVGSTPKRMIAMIDYQSTLLGRTEVAEGTMAFQFERPNNTELVLWAIVLLGGVGTYCAWYV